MKDRSEKISKLKNSRQSRESYIRSKLNILIPSQIRGLRLRYSFTQKELGEMADMKQARISAIESPGEAKFNIDTLIRLAAALKVGLCVKFVSFSELLQWENDFSQDEMKVKNIDEDTDFLSPMVQENIYDASYLNQEMNSSFSITKEETGTWMSQRGFKDSASNAATITRSISGSQSLFREMA